MSDLHKEMIPRVKPETRSKQISSMVEPSLYRQLQEAKGKKDPHLSDSTLVYKLIRNYVDREVR